MVTKNVTLNNQTFTLNKMDAIEQLGVASKLLPLVQKAGLMFRGMGEDSSVDDITGSLTDLLKEIPAEDLQFLMTKFLEKTYIGNICVINKGRIVQPELVELDTAILLVKEHFMLNFESYLKYVQ